MGNGANLNIIEIVFNLKTERNFLKKAILRKKNPFFIQNYVTLNFGVLNKQSIPKKYICLDIPVLLSKTFNISDKYISLQRMINMYSYSDFETRIFINELCYANLIVPRS